MQCSDKIACITIEPLIVGTQHGEFDLQLIMQHLPHNNNLLLTRQVMRDNINV